MPPDPAPSCIQSTSSSSETIELQRDNTALKQQLRHRDKKIAALESTFEELKKLESNFEELKKENDQLKKKLADRDLHKIPPSQQPELAVSDSPIFVPPLTRN